jgi:hypothetical protein
MTYYDKFGHIVPFGEEERYYKENKMEACSEIEYYSHKKQIETNEYLFKITEEFRKPKKIDSIDISSLLEKPKKIKQGPSIDIIDILKLK